MKMRRFQRWQDERMAEDKMAGEQRLRRRSLLTVACLLTPVGQIRHTCLETHFITSKELMKLSQSELDSWGTVLLLTSGSVGLFCGWHAHSPSRISFPHERNQTFDPLWWISEVRWPVRKWTSTPQHPHNYTPLHIFHRSTLLQRKRSSAESLGWILADCRIVTVFNNKPFILSGGPCSRFCS